MKPFIPTLLTIALFFAFTISVAQKGKMEKISQICTNLTPQEKTIVAVTSFANSATNNDKFKSSGLIDMLSNALFNTGCYNVVERKNLNEVINEQDISNSNRFDKKTVVKIGKLKGAGILVMGNVTEFSENSGGFAVGGLVAKAVGGLGMIDAHLGMIIKLVDTKTGMLLDSKSFERTVSKMGAAGAGTIGMLPGGAVAWKSKAMQDAAEELIINIVEYITSTKTLKNNIKEVAKDLPTGIEIVFKNIKYDDVQKFVAYLKANSNIKDIQKKYENSIATFNIDTALKSDELADYINNFKEVKLEITSVVDEKIEIKTKSKGLF